MSLNDRLASVTARLEDAYGAAEAFSSHDDVNPACFWWTRVSRLEALRAAIVRRMRQAHVDRVLTEHLAGLNDLALIGGITKFLRLAETAHPDGKQACQDVADLYATELARRRAKS